MYSYQQIPKSHLVSTFITEKPTIFTVDMAESEIITNQLFIGDAQDAMLWKGVRLCVLEGGVLPNELNALWIPVFNIDASGKADHAQLDKAAAVIDSIIKAGNRLLVHCAAGIERSPLTVAWYLSKSQNISIEEAYKIVIAKRPQAQDRTIWL